MKYTMFDSEGRSWEMETLPRSVTPNFIGMTEEEKQKMRKEYDTQRTRSYTQRTRSLRQRKDVPSDGVSNGPIDCGVDSD
jgi:hypothetical protein